MSFLNPIWLWGLGALAVPVGIHLLSRKEGKTIRIGSIRFLTETSTSKFSSIRLNELLLLIVRCILVALLVLFLAGMLLKKTGGDVLNKWVLIENGLENEAPARTLLDSLRENGYEIRRLQKGFPELNDDGDRAFPDYYALAQELALTPGLQAIVLATNSVHGFKGKRIPLPDNLLWLPYPETTKIDPPLSLPPTDTLNLILVHDTDFSEDKNIIHAALSAIQGAAPKQIILTESSPGNFNPAPSCHWVIWLSHQHVTPACKTLYFRESAFQNLITQQSPGVWHLTQHLTPENALEYHLSIQLMDMLFGAEARQDAQYDQRTLANELAWADSADSEPTATQAAGEPADKILFLSLVFVFIVERILAFYRKQ